MMSAISNNNLLKRKRVNDEPRQGERTMNFTSPWFNLSISTVVIVVIVIALTRPDLLGNLIEAFKNLWSK